MRRFSRVMQSAFLAWAALNGTAAPAAVDHYIVINLGTFGCDTHRVHEARKINESGQIVGVSRDTTCTNRAFLVTPEGRTTYFKQGPLHANDNELMLDLGTLGGSQSNGFGINDEGQVTGSASQANGPGAFLLTPICTTQAVPCIMPPAGCVWNVPMADLGYLSVDSRRVGRAVNCQGQVVGIARLGNNNTHAFLWRPTPSAPAPYTCSLSSRPPMTACMIDLSPDPPPPANPTPSAASDVSDAGHIVGNIQDLSNQAIANLWVSDAGPPETLTSTVLGTLGGSTSNATSINELNQVVGIAARVIDPGPPVVENLHAFFITPVDCVMPTGCKWNQGATPPRNDLMTDLGVLRPAVDIFSTAQDINDAGQIVGYSASQVPGPSDPFPGDPHAFLYDGGMMIDLNTRIPAGSDWVLERALGINENGFIVGVGRITPVVGDEKRAFVLIPDNDDDGIPDLVENAVGGAGIDIDPAGSEVTCAELLPDDTIEICVKDPITGQEFKFVLPLGTTAMPGPIELKIAGDPQKPQVQILGAMLPLGSTKAVTLPFPNPSAADRVIIKDEPGDTAADLTNSDGNDIIQIPTCTPFCPASESDNVNGGPTDWTVTNNGDGTVKVSGLMHTALGITDLVPADRGFLDIKPGSCPNPLNRHGNGALPVALAGTAEFDPAQVDLSTLQLSRADGVGGSVAPIEGPPGPHSVFEDVATPFDGEGCACHDLGGDGIDDLSIKFRTRDVVDALELNNLSGGAVVELVLRGSVDGTPFVAGDCITVVPPGDLAPANAFVGSNVTDTFVAVGPIDLNFDGDGFANFARSYYSNTVLTLTAPSRSAGRRFVRWSINGVLQEGGVRTLELVVDQDINLRAIYERGRRLRPDRPTEDGGSVE